MLEVGPWRRYPVLRVDVRGYEPQLSFLQSLPLAPRTMHKIVVNAGVRPTKPTMINGPSWCRDAGILDMLAETLGSILSTIGMVS